ncbi:MAG: ATP-binding protein [Candidatus Omnitrophica bacterium]|nr:ATP-binding protein [Candidatus Omnitrophota bacterium]
MFADPVIGKDFFNRGEMLHLLFKRASSLRQGYRQNVAILGPELIGKSSLLQHFMLQFDDPGVVVVYVELRPRETFQEFTSRFVTIFLHAFLKRLGIDLEGKGGEQKYLQAFHRWAPITASWLKGSLEQRRKSEPTKSFITLLELPSRTWNETGKCFILMLDEFDKLLGFDIEEPFAHLGRQIMVQKETMYLLASSQIQISRRILQQRLSLLFGRFEIVTLEPFTGGEAMEYLEKRWGLASLDPGVKQFLVFLSGGHPFYLNVLGQHLSTCPSTDLKSPLEHVIFVLEKVLFNAQGILCQYFTMLLHRLASLDHRSSESALIVQALSRRTCPSQEIRHLFKESKDIQKKLAKLLDAGILSKSGIFYRVADRLFAFWLKSCFERKADSLAGNIAQQSFDFRTETEETVKHFMEQSQKRVDEKISTLFSCFKGELVEIDQKRHRLPRFSGVSLLNGKTEHALIVGHKDNGVWVSSFFEREIQEEDIFNFLKQCEQMNRPIHQRVLIPLLGISQNARLLAKKEKLWTWELGSVNMLLDIYHQGPILTAGEKHG